MRRNISLYIGGKRADLDDDSLILFNYTQEMLENPTIVKNSYTQQIKLKGTANNNRIFGASFRLDRKANDNFNARKKTPFAIYNERNEVIESGYARLDSISEDNEYSVTLYGGVGSFLYQLAYNEDGNARTLADLDFLGSSNPSRELDFTMDRLSVSNAWSVLQGTRIEPMFNVINFAVCYDGIPEDFNASEAIIDGSLVGRTGTYKATLARDYTAMEAHDIRSYLTRPVIKVSAIFRAIERFASSIGWSFFYDREITYRNKYYEDTWMTLPLVKVKDNYGMRSGQLITKAELLKGTSSPADYLLSFCKMFGMKLLCDKDAQRVKMVDRNTFFVDETIDLSKRLDLSKDRKVVPLVMASKWYDMQSEDKGEFAETYKESYNRVYGSQRINTGYEFNADTKVITDKIVFKGGVQSMERSSMFRVVTDIDETMFYPAPFIEGGTFEVGTEGNTSTFPLTPSEYTYQWWGVHGWDMNDYLQLHGKDNKPVDGANVLLFFDAMISCPSDLVLTDDLPTYMTEQPCWNYTSTNRIRLSKVPHFSRFKVSESRVTASLDFGEAKELNQPFFSYDTPNVGVYADRWKAYLTDRYDENTKMVTLKVDMVGMRVGEELLRRFYWFGNSLWTLNKINNYSLTTYDPVECEFIQVQDKEMYLNGQI